MASTSGNHHKKPSDPAVVISPAPEDDYLSNSTHLSREEVLRRRSNHLKQLTKCYRHQYWGLMEELRFKYGDYVRKFGRSAFQEGINEDENDTAQLRNGIDAGAGDGMQCTFHGCTKKAMILTRFCKIHILSDPKQQLYKPCEYGIKRGLNDVKCGKPVLRSMVPSLCDEHFQKAHQHVMCALKKAGLNTTSTNRIAPKLHLIVTEYVRKIQERRKIASRQKLEIDN